MAEFGRRYRISFDPAYDPKGRPRDKLDPWMMVIPCRLGTIYPFGGTDLVIEVDGHRKIRGRLSRLPCCRIHQDGDDDGSFIFDLDDFGAVAEVAKPHRRPQLTDEQREASRQRMNLLNQSPMKTTIKRPNRPAGVSS